VAAGYCHFTIINYKTSQTDIGSFFHSKIPTPFNLYLCIWELDDQQLSVCSLAFDQYFVMEELQQKNKFLEFQGNKENGMLKSAP